MCSVNSKQGQKIGIMADSHGQTACLQKALDYFSQSGCDRIYHLGDICDSAHPQSADACVQLLLQQHVLAIKGNNDHQVVVNHVDNPRDYISKQTIDFLQQLPLMLEIEAVVLAHSLPFIKARGLSSMIAPMGKNEACHFFGLNPHKILIRGHSHLPELIQSRHNTIVTTVLSPGEIRMVADILPGILTCGAADHGFVLIWDRVEQTICSYKLR